MAKYNRSTRPAPRRRRKTKAAQPPQWVTNLFQSPEFRPDTPSSSFWKVIHFTQQQRLRFLKWGLYTAVCLLCLIVQDVIMSRTHILGATTDLTAGVLLLLTVLEGTEVGSVFILLSSMIYYFSGSAPGPYCVALLTVLGIGATLLRQGVWHRSAGSIVLCAGTALTCYELGLYGIGLFLELTRWDRLFAFLVTSILTVLVMIPLYHLLYRIGQIGGYVWKE